VVSAHNVCHLLCTGAVAALSVFGITASASGPLMFLESLSWPFWSMGLAVFAVTLVLLAMRPGCISRNLIAANGGLLLVGLPLSLPEATGLAIQATGAAVVGWAVVRSVRGRASRRQARRHSEPTG
jgi:hypothetical protein